MSIIAFDRREEFTGLGQIPGQDWLVFYPRELRLVLFHPRILLRLIPLLGQTVGLIKARGVISDACKRVRKGLEKIPGVPETPTLLHIIRALQDLTFPDSRARYLKSALVELKALHRSPLGYTWSVARSDFLDRILAEDRHVVIVTRGLSVKMRRLLIGYVLLYCVESGYSDSYVVIDEIQPILTEQGPDTDALATIQNAILLGRGSGVRLIGGAQMPDDLANVALSSCSLLACSGLHDSPNIKATAGAFGLPHGDSHQLMQGLDQEEVLFRHADRPGPFRIDVPEANVPDSCNEQNRRQKVKDFLDDCDIRRGPDWSKVKPYVSDGSSSSGNTSSSGDVDDDVLLQELARSHRDPLRVGDLAGKLGQSSVAISRHLKQLEGKGLVRRQVIHIGRARVTFAEPTADGFKKLGRTAPSGGGRGGPAHRHLVGQVAEHYRDQGFTTTREPELQGKRIDLVVTGGSGRTLVEVELTDANCRRNATADLQVADPADQLLFVTPTKKLLRKVKRHVKDAVDNKALGRIDFVAFRDL